MGADTGAERCAFRHPWLPARCALCLRPSVSVPRAPPGSSPPRARRLRPAKRTVPLLLSFATHRVPLHMRFPTQLRAMQAGSARFTAHRAPGAHGLPDALPPAPAAPARRTPPTPATSSARPFRAARRTGRRRPRGRGCRLHSRLRPPPGCSPRRRPGQSRRRCRG